MNAATKLLLLRPRGVSLVNYLRTIAGYFGTWPMQEATGTTALADNVALALGRRLNAITYADYTPGVGWSDLGSDVAHCDGSQAGTSSLVSNPLLQLAIGKTYNITFPVANRSAGSVRFIVAGVVGTSRASDDTYSQEITAISASGFQFLADVDFIGDIDLKLVTVQQTGILDSSEYPGAELIVGGMTAAGWDASGDSVKSNPSADVLRLTQNTSANPNISQDIMIVGKKYKRTGRLRTTGGDNAVIYLGLGNPILTLVNPATWTDYDVEGIATTDGRNYIQVIGGNYVEIAEDSITEANPLNGDYVGVSLAQPGAGNIPYMVTFDGATSYLDIYSAELNSAIDFGGAGTLIIPARVANAGVWTDSAIRRMVRFADHATNPINQIFIGKTATNNQIECSYKANNISESILFLADGTLSLFTISITWDVDANGGAGEFKAYFNDVQQGATLAIGGVWNGNIISTAATVGASNTTPLHVWHGDEAYSPVIATVALPQTTIAQINAAFGVS